MTDIMQRESTPLVELLGCFAVAGELGRGQPAGHVSRTAAIAVAVADRLPLEAEQRAAVLPTALLVHAGCTAGVSEVATVLLCDELALMRDVCICDPANELEAMRVLLRHSGRGSGAVGRLRTLSRLPTAGARAMREMEAGCSDVGSKVAARLGMPGPTVEALGNICETWNGKGFRKRRGEDIPVVARIVSASMVAEIFLTDRGPDGARSVLKQRSGRSIDPAIATAMIELFSDTAVLAQIEAAREWAAVASLATWTEQSSEPLSLDDLTLACADFTDLKVPGRAAHSRRVGALAEAIMLRLGNRGEASVARGAGHVHAIGQVGLPLRMLTGQRLSTAEDEQLRLHTTFTKRILAHSESLARVGQIGAMHHERADGHGYPDGRAGADFPAAARAVAAACAWDDLTLEDDARDLTTALATFREGGREAFGAEVLGALCDEVSGARRTQKRAGPEGLTAREVEVLTLAARGKTVGEIAGALVISKHTARHHLESIYGKAGISSRSEATLFAIEEGLLG